MPFHTLGTLENPPQADSEASQLTINTEARDAIKDLFPNIPQGDLFQIIKTAFQKVSFLTCLEGERLNGRECLMSISGSTESRHGA